MAPSPELGQPKAPDKTNSSHQPHASANDHNHTMAANHHKVMFAVDATSSESAAGAAAAALANNKSSITNTNSTPSDSQNLGKMDDVELKKLLDEAITYKRPKDREHKSEIFKELLQHAELEDQARADCYINCVSRSNRGSNRHTQGGSLQDLVEAVRHDRLDPDFPLVGNTRRNQHNSRQKKYSSVSSRQREGGSLPSNVNANQCPYEDSFLTEFNKRKNKLDKVHGSSVGTAGGLDEVAETSPRCVPHTVIQIEQDETRHVLAHDSLALGIKEPTGGFGDDSSNGSIEMSPLMKKLPRVIVNYTTPQIVNLDVTIGDSSRHSADSIDSTVQFKTLLMNNNSKQIDVNPMQLNNSYMAVNSVIERKGLSSMSSTNTCGSSSTFINSTSSNGPKYTEQVQVKIITDSKHIDENGNALQITQSGDNSVSITSPISVGATTTTTTSAKSKTKNVNKADRNTKTLKAYEIPGNRGNDDMEQLVAFIENRGPDRRNAGKRKPAKLKKSNSMEELKSCSKIEDEAAQSKAKQVATATKSTGPTTEVTVTLRHKQQATTGTTKRSANSSGEASSKESQKQHQPKRGERRSWGTEELTYLGDTNEAPVASKEEEVGIVVKKANTTSSHTSKESAIASTLSNQIASKKREEHSLSIVSIESISTSSETAEFHVVTKKKKVKKRTTVEETLRQTPKFNGPNSADRRFGHPDPSAIGYTNRVGKYQTSHNNTNDREAYLPHSSFYASHSSSGSGAKDYPPPQNHQHPNQNHQTHHKRRKSTSSVPPSDKSDSSDLESVISLPTESTKRLTATSTTQTTANNATTKEPTPVAPPPGPAQISYADIARISNPEKTTVVSPSSSTTNTNSTSSNSILSPNQLDKWPAVSTKTNSSIDQSSESTSNISSCSSTSNKSIGTHPAKPDLNDIPVVNATAESSASSSTMSTTSTPKPVSYSQLLIDNENNQKALPQVLSPPSMSSSATSAIPSSEEGLPKKVVSPADPNKSDKAIVKTNLQKSKSVDRDIKVSSTSIDDQYPALIKTVKKNQTQSIVDGPLKIAPVPIATAHKSASSIPAVVFTSNISVASIISGEPMSKKQTKTSKSIAVAVASNADSLVTKQLKSTGIAEKSGTSKKQIAKREKSTSSTRPAVVIFSDRHEIDPEDSPNSPPLLFGDFNDDVLRLLEQDSDPSTIQYISVPNTDFSSSSNSSMSPLITECCCAAASTSTPQSDLGYSSSSQHTRSIASQSHLDVMDEPTTMSFLGNSIDNIVENVPPSAIPAPSGDGGKKSKNKPAKNETAEQPLCNAATAFSSSSSPSPHTSSAMLAGETTGTSVVVAAALEAIALQNKSAVNSMATAKVLTELTVRYVAPPPASYQNRANYNHDKIVNFVGMAWQDILVGGYKFYNDGQ